MFYWNIWMVKNILIVYKKIFNNKMFNKFSSAPLFGYTNKYCRFFYSLFTKYIKLYTEMIHTSFFTNNYYKKKKFFNEISKVNVAIQLAGNSLKDLYFSSKIISKLNFSEINFNIGCPSFSAKKGKFGFYLSNNLKKIIDCLNVIKNASPDILLSIKHRINLFYSYNFLLDFVGNINLYTKCNYFIIHARSIVNNNYSIKKNLFSPLNYKLIYKLKKDLPHINIIINGNIKNLYDIDNHLKYVDGVMIGRWLYFNPLILLSIDIYFNNIFLNKKCNIDFLSKNNNLFWMNNNINFKIRNILYLLYKYINKNNIKPINILKHVVHIFYNINNASVLRKRILKSSNFFEKFNSYYDFEYYLFKNIIYY